MSTQIFIPATLRDAAQHLRAGWQLPPDQLSKNDFVRAWSAVAYLFPGLHPDGFDDPESGWPVALKQFAAEAWRRTEAGELDDTELYSSDAQWAGIYDRMRMHPPEEMARRVDLASASS